MTTTIFLADDHPIVRDGLRLVLETELDLKVVGEAGNGRQAVQQVCQRCPDVVIIDITMPELNGIEATRQIRECSPATQVIVLSIHATTQHVSQAFEAGAAGYMLKGTVSTEVIDAVRTVQAGQRYFGPQVLNLVSEDHIFPDKSQEVEDPLIGLSPREREVLQLVVEGHSSAEIAETLSLSPKTVETYRYRVMRKLNLSDIPSLVKFAIQSGLTPLE